MLQEVGHLQYRPTRRSASALQCSQLLVFSIIPAVRTRAWCSALAPVLNLPPQICLLRVHLQREGHPVEFQSPSEPPKLSLLGKRSSTVMVRKMLNPLIGWGLFVMYFPKPGPQVPTAGGCPPRSASSSCRSSTTSSVSAKPAVWRESHWAKTSIQVFCVKNAKANLR